MSEIKVELIRLLRIPITGLTIVLSIWILGVDVGGISEIGMGGIKFYPDTINQTKEKKEISKNKDLNVSIPTTALNTIKTVESSKYSDTPSAQGWVYLGTYSDGIWNDRVIEISEYLTPEVGKSYFVVAHSIYIRTAKPAFPFYKLKPRIGLAKKGDLLRIVALDTNLGRNRVWAKVDVYPALNGN